MNTHFNDLKEQETLAPLQEEKLEEFYAPKNLTPKDASILATISKSSITAIESTIGTLSHLIQNLKIYKECIVDSINLQAESADITTKYSKEIPQQSHILPGIISVPQAYNLNDIKTDNERMLQIKTSKDKSMKQKDIYLRISQEDVRLFLSSWKRLNLANASFDEFVESLNMELK